MITETLTCRLYETRTDLGFTQQQVADGTDMSVRTIINIEKGKSVPTLLYAMRIADFLNLPVDQLFEYRSTLHTPSEKDEQHGK